MKERQIKHWKEIIALQEKLKANLNKGISMRDKVENLRKQHKEFEDDKDRDVSREFAFRYVGFFNASQVHLNNNLHLTTILSLWLYLLLDSPNLDLTKQLCSSGRRRASWTWRRRSTSGWRRRRRR